MADEELVVKASIDDELSTPLKGIRDDVRAVGNEAEQSGRRASTSSRGWATFGRVAKGALVGVAAAAGAAGYATFRLLKSSVAQASSLAESLNAVNVTYGKQAKAVKQLGREAARSIGLSNVEFNGMAVQFAAFAEAIGGQGKGAVRVLDDVTTRAADFASVMNIDVAEAAALFQSGLAGESEPLRRYGINLSAAAVESYALSKGIIEGKEALTDAQKVQATYGLLMEKTSKTAGDFRNTSDSLANQQRILGARFDNAQAKLGRGLLPMMQKGAQWLNREGVPAFVRFSDWFTNEGIPKMGAWVDKGRAFYETHGPQIRQTLGDVRDVAQQGADAAGELVDAFLRMPSWARKLLVGGLAGGAIAHKTGLLGAVKGLSKGAGGLASLASKAKPLPVFVVNNGVPGTGVPGLDTPDKAKPGKVKTAVNTVGKYALPVAAVAASVYAVDRGLNAATNGKGERTNTSGVVSQFGATNEGYLAAPSKAQIAEHKAAAKRVEEAYATAMDLARLKAAGFGRELDLVGARKVTPRVSTDSIATANDALATFIGRQIEAGRPVAPYINTTSIERAYQQVQNLSSAIHAIPSAGIDNSVPYVSGGNRPVPPASSGGGGGKGGGDSQHGVDPRRRRGDTVTLPSPRRTAGAGGGIHIEPGAIRVDASNASRDVDVTGAVKRGIEDWMREREERR